MPTYICTKCGCVDNTACGGNYWGVMSKQNYYKDEYSNTHVLCVECTPSECCDGSVDTEAGKWHDIFPKKHWSEYGTKEKLIADCKKDTGNMVNAIEYFGEEVEPMMSEFYDERIILKTKTKTTINKPELARKTAQGRNELCNCKSGKKYKNCCGKE